MTPLRSISQKRQKNVLNRQKIVANREPFACFELGMRQTNRQKSQKTRFSSIKVKKSGKRGFFPTFLYTFRSKKLPAQPVSSRKNFRFKLRRKASWSTLSLECRSNPKVTQEAQQCQKTTQIVYHTRDGIASTISYLRRNFVDRLCTVRSK